MRRFFADRPAATWFGLTFLISWGGILAVGAPAGFPAPTADAEALFPATLGVMLAGPVLAAVLTAALVDGWSGVRAWLMRFTEWRVPAGWYAAALLPVPIIAGVLGLFATFRPGYAPALATTDDPVGLLLTGLAVGVMAGLFEEPGWTGYALPALRERHGVLASGLILGVAWGTWHLLVTAWASGDADGRRRHESIVGPGPARHEGRRGPLGLADNGGEEGGSVSLASTAWPTMRLTDPFSTWAGSPLRCSVGFRPGGGMHLSRGQLVGGWVVEHELGAGGVAVVYRVRHEATGVRKALKVLHLPHDRVQKRLLREGRAQGALVHPHIVAFDEILDVNGAPALLMEWVKGPSLRDLLQFGALAIDDLDRLGRQLLAAIGHAHRHGVVHRDLKPSNVLLALDPQGSVVPKIADFGLARADGDLDGLHTRTGAMLGTPLYVAPEQVEDAKRAGPRADLFSLAALLYEAATGSSAFDAPHTRAVLNRSATGDYVPPEQLRPELPARIVGALHDALRPDPEARVPDAATFLARWADGTEGPTYYSAELGVLVDRDERTEEAVIASDDSTFLLSLPEAPDHLIGRGPLFLSIQRRRAPGHVVVLTGPGGVGKTALARALVDDDGRFVDASVVRDADGLARALAEALGVRTPGDEALAEALAATHGRVVLDNLEQIDAAAERVARWRAAAPGVAWLLTSRAAVGVPGEAVFEVPPLPPHAAIELLRRRTHGGLTVAEAGDVAARLDGLPLALELAAARAGVWSADELLERLAEGDVLAAGGATRRSLADLLRWAWDQLGAEARQALTELTVFPAPFRSSDAEAVLAVPDPVAALEELAAHALLHREGDRWRVLRTVQQAAGQRGEPGGAAARHAAHYATFGVGSTLAALALRPATEHLRTAAEWSLAHGELVHAAQAARALGVAALNTARPQAPALLAAVVAAHPPAAHAARLLTLLGMLDDHISRVARAKRWLRKAERAAREAGDHPELLLNVHMASGNLLRRRGELEEADRQYAAAMELSGPDLPATARLLTNRASVVAGLGRSRQAITLGEEALDVAELSGDDHLALVCQCNLATYHAQAGDLEQAAELLRGVLPTLIDQGDHRTAGLMRANLAQMLFELGRADEAHAAVLRALDEIDRSGDVRNRVDPLWTLARIHRHRGELPAAERALSNSLTLARRLGDRSRQRRNLELQAELAEAQGDPATAQRLRSEAAALRGP